MTMIQDEANAKNIHKLFVHTYGFQAQDFYLKQGFHVIGTVPKYLLGNDNFHTFLLSGILKTRPYELQYNIQL